MQEIFDELIELQKRKLYQLAVLIVPGITPEDLLQPCDYPELEHNPLFRHEEGVLEGLYTAKMAFILP